jgi:hypothetical protein
VNIGRKSTLFLAYAYEFDQDGGENLLARSEAWKRREIKGVALLPHLDEYVRKGELLRAYDVAGDLRAALGGKEPWKLVDAGGEEAVEITITEPPRIYVLDTHYVFIVIGIAPFVKKGEELTLATLQDVAYALVRANIARVAGTSPQMTKWLEAHQPAASEPLILRRWLAALVPGLRGEAPRGAPRTTAPALFSVILTKEQLNADDRHRLRLVHRSDQVVEPAGVDDETGEWKISSRELCLFSTFGVSWIVTVEDGAATSQFLNDAPHMIRDRYVYKWLLVEHQRLCLLALNTECADMSKGIDGANFAEMRMRLLTFIAKYNFRHVSNEERHDRFYKRVRDAVSIDDLLAEVQEEVIEIDTQLASRRAELLNHVLAFLTLVLTPVGIMCSIFQSDTIPGPLRFDDFVSATSWLHLFTHAPFLVTLAAAAVGATVYVRIFGSRVIFRQLRFGARGNRETRRW